MDRVSYSMFPLWRPFVFALFGVMVAAGVFSFFAPNGSNAGPGPLFGAAWFLILLWNAYWFLFRVSYRIELEGNHILWFTPLRHGEFPLDDLVSIRSPLLIYQLSIFKRRSGASVIMMVQRGLFEFGSEVHRRAPEVTVTSGIYEKFLRVSGWNGFQRGK
jgi:hypothetical protein